MGMLDRLIQEYNKNVDFVGGEYKEKGNIRSNQYDNIAVSPEKSKKDKNQTQNVDFVACTRERDQYILPSSSNILKNNISLLRASDKSDKFNLNHTPWSLNPEKCFVCGSDNFWRLKTNDKWICHICHPPGPSKGAIVYRIHTDGGENFV